ncbi:MAG: UDP-N-acetylmuramate dehydrogenase [Acidobacteria bacterium]|nr:UDP-N-acetylmuramate dehydrogenase [Acidobacteriota bacterium]
MKPLRILENRPLAPLTTFKIGGAARFFVCAETEDEVVQSVRFARERSLPLFVLGGGSNILIADQGFEGLVLQIGIKGISRHGDLIVAAAGEDWDEFCAFCVAEDLAGIECLSGIPGFVGGTPVQNVGAYGQEVSETIESVRALDLQSMMIVDIANTDCGFAYRSSIFNSTARNRYVVLSVTFRLIPGGTPKIEYKDLKNHFGDRSPTLSETRETVLRIRAEKGMLVRQGGADSNSAGSFFKNPIVPRKHYTSIAEHAYALGLGTVPYFEAGAGLVKIPAAWLIENSGFKKGYTKGRAGISTRHSLALTNRGNATAEEILALKTEVADAVRERFRIELTPEPVFLGFGDDSFTSKTDR